MKNQRTVRFGRYGERLTVQQANDGTDWYYVETDDGTTNTWLFVTGSCLERMRDAIDTVLERSKQTT